MKFGALHHVLLSLVTLLSSFALFFSVQPRDFFSMACFIVLLGSSFTTERFCLYLRAHKTVRFIFGVGSCLVWLRFVFWDAPFLFCLINQIALLFSYRLVTRRGAGGDHVLLLLSLIQIVLGSMYGRRDLIGTVFFCMCLLFPLMLMLSQLRREVEGNYRQGARDRAGLPVDVPRILRSKRVIGEKFMYTALFLSLPLFAIMTPLFLCFPRLTNVFFEFPEPRSRLIGFSDRIDLGQIGPLRRDQTVALRFKVEGEIAPQKRKIVRLRGAIFDTYSGSSWLRQEQSNYSKYTPQMPSSLHATDDEQLLVELVRPDPLKLFSPLLTRSAEWASTMTHAASTKDLDEIESKIKIETDQEGSFSFHLEKDAFSKKQELPNQNPLRYRLVVSKKSEPLHEIKLQPEQRNRYLDLSPQISSKIRNLAHMIADGKESPVAQAWAINSYLSEQYTYSLSSPSSSKPDPIYDFLFESKKGHCEFFATSLVLMLRALDIPSRQVSGYIGGTYNQFTKKYTVRQGDAHAWVEAYFEDANVPGWYSLDPTPKYGVEELEYMPASLQFVTDIVEWLSDSWSSHVMSYGWQSQHYLVDQLESKLHRGSEPRKVLLYGLIFFSLTLTSYAGRRYYYKMKREGANAPEGQLKTYFRSLPQLPWGRVTDSAYNAPYAGVPTSSNTLLRLQTAATASYSELEIKLGELDLARPLSVPPLIYAQRLLEMKFPFAEALIDATNEYQKVRFGRAKSEKEAQRALFVALEKLDEFRRNRDPAPL